MLSCYVWSAYIIFIVLDLLSFGVKTSNWIKYSIIVALFFHSLLLSFVEQKQSKISSQRILVTVALFIVLCADYLLLFTEYFSVGVHCFIAVQCVYKKMIDLKINETAKWKNCKKSLLFLALQGILFVVFPKQFLYIVAGQYACLLLWNMFTSWNYYKETSHIIPLAITMLFLCDCNVMLANITNYTIFWRLIWIFYIPSQFLLEKYVDV